MSERLYPTLDCVAGFVLDLEALSLADKAERARAAIARYIAEMPASDLFDARADWRAFAEGRRVDRPGKAA